MPIKPDASFDIQQSTVLFSLIHTAVTGTADVNAIWTGLFANLKRLGHSPPHPNLAISSQKTMKHGKGILWVETFTNSQKFFMTLSSC